MNKLFIVCGMVAIASFVAGWSLSPTKVENKLVDSLGFEWTEEDIVDNRIWANQLLDLTYILKQTVTTEQWDSIKLTEEYIMFATHSEVNGESVECYGLE